MEHNFRHKQCLPQSSYISIFKIDRTPILPPLMTTEKRKQMLKFKERAIAIEKQLQERRKYPKVSKNLTSNDLIEEETFELFSNMLRPRSSIPAPIPSSIDRAKLRKQYVEASTSTNALTPPESLQSTDSSIQSRMVKLSRSETLIYDNSSNSVIMSLNDYNGEIYPKENDYEEAYKPTVIPSICVDPPTPMVSSKPIWSNFDEIAVEPLELTKKAPRRSVTSPQLKPVANQSSDCQLIRSNSFTLEGPSRALLEHIRNQKVTTTDRRSSSTLTQHTVESKAKRVKKVELKKTRPVPKRSEKPNSQTGVIPNNNKAKRSPYELKPNSKIKLLRKHKTSTATVNKKKTSIKEPSPINCENAALCDIEVKHRQKVLELINAQRQKQHRLQQIFEAEQKKLFDELTAQMGSLRSSESRELITRSPSPQLELSPLPSPTQLSLSNSATNSESFMLKSSSNLMTQSLPSSCASSESSNSAVLSSIRCTPRRRLFSRDASPVAAGSTTRRNSNEQNLRIAAATKINAYTRSYLVRRILRTTEVQQIIQTIRDTLIFALNMHLDTKREGSDSAENIKLKARLLQQLSSASRALHFVFFQTSIKERMSIISRDRERAYNKALLSKRSPRIVANNELKKERNC